MKTITTAAGLLLALSAFGGGKDPKPATPEYSRAAETKFTGKVAEVREVGTESVLPGIYLTVTVKTDTIKVYVGPKSFVNLFGVTFKAGDGVDITGAKVQFEAGELILGREIVIGRVTLILRDESGWPNWDYSKPRAFPTGL
jgi:hypothetical protein